jgi:hypothetical protein
MNVRLQSTLGTSVALAVGLFAIPMWGADEESSAAGSAASTVTQTSRDKSAPVSSEEFERLKAQLAAQQQQIEQLRLMLESQQKLLTRVTVAPVEETQAGFSLPSAKLGEVASNSPIIPGGNAVPASVVNAKMSQGSDAPSPLSLKIGDTYITPVGFMDLTYVYRSKNTGSGIGSNFAGVPYSNTTAGRLSDGQLSPQNSRIGARFDALVHGTNVLGYWESDFLGNQPAGILINTNSAVLRLRVFFVDLRKGQFEVLGGQSWSLLTPNRKGLSPLPGDIFYSNDIDTDYQIGIPWARIPTLRVVWHPTDKIAWGIAAENAQQYGGGGSGSAAITLPAALSAGLANQINTNAQNFSVPTVHPDIITKIAFDPEFGGHQVHFEMAGMIRRFQIVDPLDFSRHNKEGGAGSVNSNIELVKGGRLRLIENFYYGSGAARYLFASGPDLTVGPTGNLGLVKAGGTVDGIEMQITKNLLFYGYYGGAYFGRSVELDVNGKPVGYGYTGSANSNNRTIEEGTFGIQNTFWKDPKWGALRFDVQYSYLFRVPWYVAPGGLTSADTHMLFLNLRYALPGQAPNLK